MNIKEITLSITNFIHRQELIISPKNNSIIIDGQNKAITDEQIYNFLRIIRDWKKYYSKSNFIDSEMFKIVITDNDNIKNIIEGVGNLPPNYQELHKWLRGISND